jgi:formate hydrogenlyase transcriptional activator
MGDRENPVSAEGSRHRVLLDAPAALAMQQDIHAVLRGISSLLSKIVPFDSIVLLLLDPGNETVQIYSFDHEGRDPGIELGTTVHFKNTAIASALEKQQPVFVPDIREEVRSIPELAARLRFEGIRGSYILPVSTSRKKLGVLVFGTARGDEFGAEDIQMMGSIAVHVSMVLENALALEAIESYREELEREHSELQRERDRLKLLLDINNHIINHLDVSELIRAASVSIRKFLKNDFTGFWLFDEGSQALRCVVLDFPGSRGYLEQSTPTAFVLPDENLKNIQARIPKMWNRAELEALIPKPFADSLRAETILSIASVPLMGSTSPLGSITVGSRQRDAFSQAEIDLIGQVGNQISLALENALAYGRLNLSRNRLEGEREYLESEIKSQYNFEDIVGKSPALKKALEQVAIVAQTDSTVLLTGETGTGKELVARAIHNLSRRRDRTFVRLNCAAIPHGLLESELFGHEKGAFTGALAQQRGRFELADQGSLFLDEIGDIDLELQPKLLRVLQEREFERLGSSRTIKVNVRLIAATRRVLPDMVRDGEFREDLFYRLNVFPIHIPPLRERKEDIPLLVHYFVGMHSRNMRKSIRNIPREVMDGILRWDWPGNVRELQNFIERSVILSPGATLDAPISELSRRTLPKEEVDGTLFATERDAILKALRAAQGKISGPGGAAQRLGLKRTTLQRKMERLRIFRSEYV